MWSLTSCVYIFPTFTSVSLLHFQVHGGPRLPHIQRPLHHRGVRRLRQRDPLLDGALRFPLLTSVQLLLQIDILKNTSPCQRFMRLLIHEPLPLLTNTCYGDSAPCT